MSSTTQISQVFKHLIRRPHISLLSLIRKKKLKIKSLLFPVINQRMQFGSK